MWLTNNSALPGHGGGMSLAEMSYLVMTGKVRFTGNKAGLGGAIYVYDTTDVVYCSRFLKTEDCFFQPVLLSNNTLMVFDGNVAKVGSVLLGGSIDQCRLRNLPGAESGAVFDAIADYSNQPGTDSRIASALKFTQTDYIYRSCVSTNPRIQNLN